MTNEREALINRLIRFTADYEKYGHDDLGALLREVRAALSQPSPAPQRWPNGCNHTVPEALRYLSANERPSAGEARFNAAHLLQLAREVEAAAAQPSPAVPVAVAGSNFQLLYAGGGTISDIVKRHGLQVGSKLYAAPQPTEPAQPADIGKAISQPATQAGAPSLEWAVQGWNDEVKNRPLVNEHRRSLDWMWRKMVKRFGGDPDALLGLDHDALQGFAPMPLHKASPGPDPTTEQPGDAALVELIVRDCCETDPADPDRPETICIHVDHLRAILQSQFDAARAAHGKGGEG